ncbi:uncharacterized protein LOC142238013 isoform X1 [Haematobia irritans]|uniref:uncharacterized protein LOC142238013 isoform X1 n=1 Tax=Haematobia irritans TaxID=7368 RepID=UPI003F4FC976
MMDKEEEKYIESILHKRVVTNDENNNHRIVPIGLLIVFVTIYLGLSSIPICFVNCTQENILRTPHIISYSKREESQKILERLLEYKDICKDLEIFTRSQIPRSGYLTDINKTTQNGIEKGVKKGISLNIPESSIATMDEGSGRGDKCSKPSYSKKTKKSKYSIKVPSNGKNGFHKNKTSKAKGNKFTKTDKKDSAEPIIYLFALVFIYLLLKAASDINQHYKSENKNDKRFLRRCSLQSYAQTHRDRRVSKEHKRVVTSSRQNIGIEAQFYKCNVETATQKPQTPSPILIPSPRVKNNWQLLRQHMTLSLDNSSPLPKPEFSTLIRSRRCSVPASAFHNPWQNKNTHGILPDQLERRISITMPLDTIDSLGIETTKRRVRMINRH